MTGIGAPTDHKENMYKNKVHRNKKLGGEREKDLVRRKRKILSFI
jgi:hypothetical protein